MGVLSCPEDSVSVVLPALWFWKSFHSPILAGFGETVLLSHLLLSVPCLVIFDWLLVSLLATVCSANKFLCALRAELIYGQRDLNSEGSLIIHPFRCCIAKETVNQLKQQPREQEKLSASYASDQGKTSISQNGFTNKCYQLALLRVCKTLFATLCLPLLMVLMLPLGMTGSRLAASLWMQSWKVNSRIYCQLLTCVCVISFPVVLACFSVAVVKHTCNQTCGEKPFILWLQVTAHHQGMSKQEPKRKNWK